MGKVREIGKRVKGALFFATIAICLLTAFKTTEYCLYRAYDTQINLGNMYQEWETEMEQQNRYSSSPHFERLVVLWEGLGIISIVFGYSAIKFITEKIVKELYGC